MFSLEGVQVLFGTFCLYQQLENKDNGNFPYWSVQKYAIFRLLWIKWIYVIAVIHVSLKQTITLMIYNEFLTPVYLCSMFIISSPAMVRVNPISYEFFLNLIFLQSSI